jgi:N-acetylglucosamine kinase-like BadF-type ATPase
MLEFNEKVGLDSNRLVELYVQLGEAGARNVVCRAVEELSVRLNQLEDDYRNGDLKLLYKGAKGLIGITEQVGMQRLADVARDVRRCVECNDPVALGATMARLLRIGNGSLTAVWDLQDLSV